MPIGTYDNWSKGQLEHELKAWPSAGSSQHIMARRALDKILERERQEEIETAERRHRESLEVNTYANRLSKKAIWISIAAAVISLGSLANQLLDHYTKAIPVRTESATPSPPAPSPISKFSPQSTSATESRPIPEQKTLLPTKVKP